MLVVGDDVVGAGEGLGDGAFDGFEDGMLVVGDDVVGAGEGLGDGEFDGFEDGMLVVGDVVGLVVGGGQSSRFVQKSATVTVWRRHLSFFPPPQSPSLPDGHSPSVLVHIYLSCVNDDVQSCASVATLQSAPVEEQVPHWGAVGAGGGVGTGGTGVGGTGVGSAFLLALS